MEVRELKKTYCDWCGKETTFSYYNFNLSFELDGWNVNDSDKRHKNYKGEHELCKECKTEIELFINRGKKKNQSE